MPHFVLTEEEIAELDRPVRGVGGFQDLLRRLQENVNHYTREIKLTDEDLEAIPRYAFDFEQGGFEDRLKAIFGRVLGENLGREDGGDAGEQGNE